MPELGTSGSVGAPGARAPGATRRFITDPPVVDKILRHIQWHPGDPLIPYIRPPPEMLKVAESSLNS